ncbi:hypothetical protein BED46_028365 [Burkholderia contaminans]|nr:hypothetical protein BGI28_19740 [Burkholderia contaminans]OMI75557.1 hypothetical protein BED46_028365 [Burkholderia contaminans]
MPHWLCFDPGSKVSGLRSILVALRDQFIQRILTASRRQQHAIGPHIGVQRTACRCADLLQQYSGQPDCRAVTPFLNF